ncbi:prepilin peptidase [bacterium]|nr:prepilin peptidase [bacterium]
MIDIYAEIFCIIFLGLAIGSFLNVCIYRIPAEKSIVKPRSKCPNCDNLIAWYDNIPVLSYIFLGGKCRHCKQKISLIYPTIEIIYAVMICHIYIHFFNSELRLYYVAYYGFLIACLLAATVIDLKFYIIPDEINLAGIVFAVVGAVIFPSLVGESTAYKGLLHSLIGMGVGFGALRFVVWIGGILFRKEAMGLGDPKFLAMIGAFLGFKSVLLIIFISSVLGTLIGGSFILFIRKNKSNTVIPYGPFLALAAYICLFYGNFIITWYVNLINLKL